MTNKLAEEIIDGHSLFQKMVTKEEVANAMEAYHKAKLAEKLPSEEEIKEYVWENIPLPLSERDKDTSSPSYNAYVWIIDYINWLLNKLK